MDISVVILVGDEEIHISRCLERLAPLEPRQVMVVESQNVDRTHEIALETALRLGWIISSSTRVSPQESDPRALFHLVWHDWPGNQAEQFNWVLDNTTILGQWVLRLDADEYLTGELIEELKGLLRAGVDYSGVALPLARTWRGRVLENEAGHVLIPRIFKRGCGRYELRVMDERLIIAGPVIQAKALFVDYNLRSFDWWKEKHRIYALKEAKADLLESELVKHQSNKELTQAQRNKALYRRLPMFIRPFIYAFYRYFAWGAWKDGWAGLDWTLWQGVWYRLLVDLEIVRLNKTMRR